MTGSRIGQEVSRDWLALTFSYFMTGSALSISTVPSKNSDASTETHKIGLIENLQFYKLFISSSICSAPRWSFSLVSEIGSVCLFLFVSLTALCSCPLFHPRIMSSPPPIFFAHIINEEAACVNVYSSRTHETPPPVSLPLLLLPLY